MPATVFRYADGVVPSLAALTYAFAGYGLGLAGLAADFWLLNVVGMLLTAHALVVAAYLVHECAHNTLFTDSRYNARLGAALAWLVGAGYGRYEDIRHKHSRHHVDRADVVAFDFRPRFSDRSWAFSGRRCNKRTAGATGSFCTMHAQ